MRGHGPAGGKRSFGPDPLQVPLVEVLVVGEPERARLIKRAYKQIEQLCEPHLNKKSSRSERLCVPLSDKRADRDFRAPIAITGEFLGHTQLHPIVCLYPLQHAAVFAVVLLLSFAALVGPCCFACAPVASIQIILPILLWQPSSTGASPPITSQREDSAAAARERVPSRATRAFQGRGDWEETRVDRRATEKSPRVLCGCASHVNFGSR